MKKTLLAATLATTAIMAAVSCQRNPLLEEWNTPFGIAPFSEIKVEHYKPAVLKAIEEHNKEIQAIINNPEAPTFENTIVALDNAGSLFERIYSVFGN